MALPMFHINTLTRFNLFPVTGLTPGNEYKFRVFAENVHGRSDASDESSTVQTKGVTSKKQPRTKYESKVLSQVEVVPSHVVS